MNAVPSVGIPPARVPLPSEAYTLKIRQGPERARLTGNKDKGRKPVDPPPIIQLQVQDANDPAQNYLQSPYFFMCCTLWDVNEERAVESDSGSSLAGTVVSSLHRLKDVDNTDGGFFVFGDLSVKLEGEYRLRFTLYEMIQESVHYLKSVVSDAFPVYPAKNFPGMAESTFLSRSFGDQGVRLRIRKETRTFIKRPTSSNQRPEDYSQTFSQGSSRPGTSSAISQQTPFLPSSNFGPLGNRDYGSEYTEPAAKRQRTSSSSHRDFFDRDTSYTNQSCPPPQRSYTTYGTPQSFTTQTQAQEYTPETGYNFNYGLDSSGPTPFLSSSPRNQLGNYGQAQTVYENQARQSTSQSQFGNLQQLAGARLQATQFNPVSGQMQAAGTGSPYSTALDGRSVVAATMRQQLSSARDEYPYTQPYEQPMAPPSVRQSVPVQPVPNVLPPISGSSTTVTPQPASQAYNYAQTTNPTAAQGRYMNMVVHPSIGTEAASQTQRDFG